jgi:hypothetical protein
LSDLFPQFERRVHKAQGPDRGRTSGEEEISTRMFEPLEYEKVDHGPGQSSGMDHGAAILVKEEHILLYKGGDRLVKKEQGAGDTELPAENGCGKAMIRPDTAEGYDMPLLLPHHIAQYELQLAHFVAAVYIRALIVALYPEIVQADMFEPFHRGGKATQGNPGKLALEIRECLKENRVTHTSRSSPE